MQLYISKHRILLNSQNRNVNAEGIDAQRKEILSREHLPVGTVFEVLAVDCGMFIMACKTEIMSFNQMDINLIFTSADISHLSNKE